MIVVNLGVVLDTMIVVNLRIMLNVLVVVYDSRVVIYDFARPLAGLKVLRGVAVDSCILATWWTT